MNLMLWGAALIAAFVAGYLIGWKKGREEYADDLEPAMQELSDVVNEIAEAHKDDDNSKDL